MSPEPPPQIERHRGSSAVFQRPAELVDVSERFYRQVFATGCWVAAALCAFAAVSSLLHPTVGSQLRGIIVCGACAAGCAIAARRPAPVYAALRRRPWILVIAGAIVGGAAWLVGPHNFQLFLPIIVVVGVAGIAVPFRVVIAAALIAGVGLALPQLTGGQGNLGGPIAVIVPPLLFWLIVDRIAGFALRLHQRLNPLAGRSPTEQPDAPAPPTAASDMPTPRGLPVPRVIAIDDVRLTSRQLQVILLACEGLNHAGIAACLEIGAIQVGRHLKNARERAGVATDAELTAWAKRHGIVPTADVA